MPNIKRLKYRSINALIIAIFIAAVVALNVVAAQMAARLPLEVDLTQSKSLELTQDSKSIIQNLTQDIEITLLNNEYDFAQNGDYYAISLNLLQQYAQYSDRITLTYVDLVRTPAFAAQYPTYTLTANDLLVKGAGRAIHIPEGDLFNQQSVTGYYGSSAIVSSKAEQEITSAIINLTTDEHKKVILLGGSDGYTPSDLLDILQLNGYETGIINFVTESIPQDTDMVLSIAPNRDFDESMLAKLDAFLYNGGEFGKTLLYAASADQATLPNLEAFLQEWGIAIHPGAVFDASDANIINTNYFFPIVDYTDTELAPDNVISKRLLTAMPYGRPIEAVYWMRDERVVVEPLSYSATSGVQSYETANTDWTPSSSEKTGARPALLISSQVQVANGQEYRSDVVVLASALSLEDVLLKSTAIANSDYFLNLFNILTGQEQTVNILPKELTNMELGITSRTAVIWGVVFVGVLPVVLALLGLTVWIRRRNR